MLEIVDTLIAVAAIWTIAVVTPGPNFFITVNTALQKSRHKSLQTVAGIVVGTSIWAVSGFFGITAIFRTLPAIYYCLKLAGGCYLIYLGLKLLFLKKNTANTTETPTTGPVSSFSLFKQGLLTNLLNPKTAAFIGSLFAATIPPDSSLLCGILYIASICTISAVWYSFVSLLFSHNAARTIYADFKTCIERIAGVLFVFFGARLAMTD